MSKPEPTKESVLGKIGDFTTQAKEIISLAEKFKTSSSEEIKQFLPSGGFSSFNSSENWVNFYGIYPQYFEQVMTLKLANMPEFPPWLKEQVRNDMKLLVFMDGLDPCCMRKFDYQAPSGEGFQCMVKMMKKQDGKIDVSFKIAKLKFTMAPERVIIKKTKSDFFHSSTVEEIKELPAYLSEKNQKLMELAFFKEQSLEVHKKPQIQKQAFK